MLRSRDRRKRLPQPSWREAPRKHRGASERLRPLETYLILLVILCACCNAWKSRMLWQVGSVRNSWASRSPTRRKRHALGQISNKCKFHPNTELVRAYTGKPFHGDIRLVPLVIGTRFACHKTRYATEPTLHAQHVRRLCPPAEHAHSGLCTSLVFLDFPVVCISPSRVWGHRVW